MTIHEITGEAPASAEVGQATIFSSATLAASGAWTRSSIVEVRGARRITLMVDYDPAAISGYPVIIPLVSCATVQPAAGDDSWFRPTVWDGSVTAAALTGTLATGTDFTISQNNGIVLMHPLAIRFAAASAATDEYRPAVPIDVTPYRWFHFQVAEVGATANPGTLSVLYSLSA